MIDRPSERERRRGRAPILRAADHHHPPAVLPAPQDQPVRHRRRAQDRLQGHQASAALRVRAWQDRAAADHRGDRQGAAQPRPGDQARPRAGADAVPGQVTAARSGPPAPGGRRSRAGPDRGRSAPCRRPWVSPSSPGSSAARCSCACLTGVPGMVLFAYFVQLPLMFVGLAMGLTASVVAVASALLINGVIAGAVATMIYGLIQALPALIVVRQALLSRQQGQDARVVSAGPAAGPADLPRRARHRRSPSCCCSTIRAGCRARSRRSWHRRWSRWARSRRKPCRRRSWARGCSCFPG